MPDNEAMAAPADTESARHTPEPGLRERKKIQTRRAIRRSAYRLFAEQGYEATPVDRIAEDAELSPSTVFRYFPAKEDIVLTGEHEPLLEAALRARPPGEAPMTALSRAMEETLREVCASAPEETALRIRLAAGVPALRARMAQNNSAMGAVLTRVLAERTGRDADDLELQVFAGAVVGGLLQTMFHWADSGSRQEPADVVAGALDLLKGGLRL